MAAVETRLTTNSPTCAAKPVIPLKHRVDVTITETQDGWVAIAVLANQAGTIHWHGTHEGKGRSSTPCVAAGAAIDAALRVRVGANRHGRGDDELSMEEILCRQESRNVLCPARTRSMPEPPPEYE